MKREINVLNHATEIMQGLEGGVLLTTKADDKVNSMKIIRLKQFLETTGLARSTIYKFIVAGTFPKSVSLNGQSVGWVDEEIQEWINARIEE